MRAGLQTNRIIIFSTNICVALRVGKIRHANQGLLAKTFTNVIYMCSRCFRV